MRTKRENGPNVDLEQLVEDIKAVVQDGQQLLKHGVSGVKERALLGAKTTDRAVRENPYQTIGLVFAAGLILGLVCHGIFSHGGEVVEDLE
jgi:ElaB/YqjD/DUF883 family membrane-anchored ribosome-binding protein